MQKRSVFNSALFWIVLIVLAITGTLFLYFNFEKANPLVNVTVQMDREEALQKASDLSISNKIGPEEFRQAATFSNDTKFQYYTELEGGGLTVFNSVIEKGIYQAYQWKVRQFRENEVNEVTFNFTPEGALYGFEEKISDDLTGEKLSPDSALVIAKAAALNWECDLSVFTLVEKSMNEKPGGRIDHTFVFERNEGNINESLFRIAIGVSGDRVTKINHFVKVPDDFERRYTEMRSANDLISTIGQAILFIIYGLIGAGLGIFFLMKQRFVLWKKALIWSVIIGLGTGLLYVLNLMPLLWFNYDTSTSAGTFIGNNVMNGILQSLLMGGVVFISALSAEGLGRYLFKNQVQFWKVWSREAGASYQVLGQTLGAYLFVPIVLSLDVLYYLLTSRYLGWWNPAGTLSDPDVLAQNLPWFGTIAISLQAGFWEEMICRAIPLAGVYLLVHKLKSKNVWMVVALFAQTIIFGMLHANYPQSPSYARVLEMIVPFIIFGLIYLRFGLLPVIITHYAVDVFWISLPLWVASSSGIWISRLIIIVLLLVPLWVVLYFRLKNKKWNNISDSVLNKSWHPLPKEEKVIEENTEELKISTQKESLLINYKVLLPVAVVGLLLWGIFTFPIKNNTPIVKVDKNEAVEMAQQLLTVKYNFDSEYWKILTVVRSYPALAHKFVWQEFPDEFGALQQSFLNSPYWLVRFVNIDASVEERAEEYIVKVGVDGRLLSYKHIWPEKRQGDNLQEVEALVLAKEAIADFGCSNINGLKLVSSKPQKQDTRTDWIIEYSDTVNYSLEKGQGRYLVNVAGNEVNGLTRYVFIPEEWKRNNEKQKSTLHILTITSNLILYAIIILGVVLGFIQWTKKQFSVKMFWVFGLGYVIISILSMANSYNDLLGQYSTGLPFSNFITMRLIGVFLVTVFLGLSIGVLGGFSSLLAKKDYFGSHYLIKAIFIGFGFAGLIALNDSFLPDLNPNWFPLSDMNSRLPVFSVVFDQVRRFVFNPVFLMILFFLVNKLTKNFKKLKGIGITIIFVAGFLATGGNASSVGSWFIISFGRGLVFILLYVMLRKYISWMPIIYTVVLILQLVELMIINPYPGAFAGAGMSVIIWGILSILWSKKIKYFNILNYTTN